MQLVRNWKRIAARAWSVRLLAAMGALSALEVAAPYAIDDIVPEPRARAVAMFLITLAAFVARFVAQPDVEPDFEPERKETHEHVDEDQV